MHTAASLTSDPACHIRGRYGLAVDTTSTAAIESQLYAGQVLISGCRLASLTRTSNPPTLRHIQERSK